MSNQVAKLKSVIQKLKIIFEKENKAISTNSIEEIPELSRRKSSLLQEVSTTLTSLQFHAAPVDLVNELNVVRGLAEQNAAELKALSKGVGDARARLKKLISGQFNTGIYKADGGAISNPNAETIVAKL